MCKKLTPYQLLKIRELSQAGDSDKEIAEFLKIPWTTVKRRRKHMGIRSLNAIEGCENTGLGTRQGKPCSWHTDVPPGESKLAIFRMRLEAGEQLFHPADRTVFDA